MLFRSEGAERLFATKTLSAAAPSGIVESLTCQREGDELTIPADLVLLAMGFVGPPADGIVAQAGVVIDRSTYATSRSEIFACGDMRRGQSLVVWAIREGRDCAAAVDLFLRRKD